MMDSFNGFFVDDLDNLLKKQSIGRSYETHWCSCDNVANIIYQ